MRRSDLGNWHSASSRFIWCSGWDEIQKARCSMTEEVDVVFIAVVLVICQGADGRDMFEEKIHVYTV
jgi:hypothetical protein